PKNFVRRNRLISGLSNVTLIIEATLKSGALITTKYALEQGKDILCLPGNIVYENSKGTNMLIQQGAKLITSSDDILDSLKEYYY
ncbi:DNA-protecting protein DprA, partial [bacterium]|nr:DNA-protecting protein DprA [bacterium]